MIYRTDLALEIVENLKNSGAKPGEKDGIIIKKEKIDEDISVITIDIVNLLGEAKMQRPMGRYVTLEIDGIADERDGITDRAAKALADQLTQMIHHTYTLKVLVAGLGNEKVTPDSLGPHTVSKVKITSHLFRLFDCDGDEEMSNVSGVAPGVSATTGMETAEVIKNAAHLSKADAVIAVDALAARNIERVSTTIQLCDTGIAPGSGMGNMQKSLNAQFLGTKVISIGVPTVIDSRTVIGEAFDDAGLTEEDAEKYFQKKNLDMVVTQADIDIYIKYFSDIIANAINITLHPGIYS